MILLSFAVIILSIETLTMRSINAESSDLPPPPKLPNHFTSIKERDEYLAKFFEYYRAISQPRFGRRSSSLIHRVEDKNFQKLKTKSLFQQQNNYSNTKTINKSSSNTKTMLFKILGSSY